MIWIFVTAFLITAGILAAVVLVSAMKDYEHKNISKREYLSYLASCVFIIAFCAVALFGLMGKGVSHLEKQHQETQLKIERKALSLYGVDS